MRKEQFLNGRVSRIVFFVPINLFESILKKLFQQIRSIFSILVDVLSNQENRIQNIANPDLPAISKRSTPHQLLPPLSSLLAFWLEVLLFCILFTNWSFR